MPRIVIILPSGLALEQREGVVESLAELGRASPLSFELVLIETPSDPLERSDKTARLALEQGDHVGLSFVEAQSDNPSDLTEATNKALRLAAQAKLDAILVGPQILLDREVILELCAVGEQDPMVGFVEASLSDEDNPLSGNQTSLRQSALGEPKRTHS